VGGFLGYGFIKRGRRARSDGSRVPVAMGRFNLEGAIGRRPMTRAETRREKAFHSPSSSHQPVSPFRGFQTPVFLSFSASLRLCARSLLHGYGSAALPLCARSLLQGPLPRVRASHDPGLSASIPPGCPRAGGVGVGLASMDQCDHPGR
jgi:hypothetical protein